MHSRAGGWGDRKKSARASQGHLKVPELQGVKPDGYSSCGNH
jgi:hypothetical protein